MRNPRWMAWIALFLIALAGMPALAQEPLARLNVSGASVDWMINGSYERVVLTVSSPEGKVTRQETKANKPLSFNLFDAKGNKRVDGVYTWELRTVPVLSTAVKEQLAASRRNGDASVELDLRKSGQLPAASVMSGAFTVAGGSFVDNDLTEGKEPAPRAKAASGSGLTPMFEADQVIPDDLIVQGSACVGLDCVNNESFGFDTIRLKENNTRIKFDDTSASAGFPANDWQLTANDSASGGASKFSIEDITGSKVPFTVTAGASTNSIFVDSTGRVGFRTSTPVLDLHVATSNTPAIRLEQNNSGGFTAQTWDIAGNEANFFVRDVTGGSKLSFRIRPGAPTSSVDISADGDVGIGTASPDEKLHVFESADENSFILMENPNTGTSAAAVLRAKSDTATVNFQAHASTRTLNRFGVAVGGYAEMLQTTGNGLLIGTTGNVPIIFGTNSASRMQIAGSGAVTVSGNFTVTGVKNFAMPDPADPKQAIYYAALEGPEAGTYFRGTGKTVGGKAVVELPGYFSRITEAKGMTVQLTPNGGWSQLYVEEKTPGRLVIRVAEGNADVEFDFLVQGVRLGYSDYQVERPNDLPVQQ